MQCLDAGVPGAVSATEDVPARFDPVADDSTPAVNTAGRENLYRAFEAVERPLSSRRVDHFEGLVVIVSAKIANGHSSFCSPSAR